LLLQRIQVATGHHFILSPSAENNGAGCEQWYDFANNMLVLFLVLMPAEIAGGGDCWTTANKLKQEATTEIWNVLTGEKVFLIV
jgi:hypothetical protein